MTFLGKVLLLVAVHTYLNGVGGINQETSSPYCFRDAATCNISLVSADMSEEGKMTALEVVQKGNQKFTFDVYKILAESDGNLFFSPTSVQVILALAHLGAKGSTAQEIAEGLHLPSDKAIIEEGFSALMHQLKGSDDTVLEVANKIYAQASFPIKEEFQASAAKFLAEAEEADFVKEAEKSRTLINEWVEMKTNKKIQNLIPQGALDALTRLVLVNAVYFKGIWSSQFKKDATSPMPFHITATEEKTVDMMHIKKKFMYTEAQQLESQVLELPYKGDQLSMVIILPKKIDGLRELERKLVDVNLPDILQKLRKVDVNVYLPKFKLEHQVDLSDTLKKLGMKAMFDDCNADFTGINDSKPGLVVSKVFHKAFIEVNEEGTEAAAATGAVIRYRKAQIPCEPVSFKADHPFTFFIKECQTQTNIFVGHFIIP
ncbi:leukocyte elastase inhibitor-like isoform X1 [Schistocerca piceifrons]|uniref:leukocyte elastase inhibitor-like isoform X1 n=2 Tax=Schistocerca piceifrons TaxID=274613 RepID=UPI001F5ED892|nr:leukocyte elastase inhibitor-like isoform X1 [Schistocerca piceifrons]